MVPREEGAVAGGRTPSKDLIEAKWKERCLTAEYKQKALEQQVSDMETDMITMSLKLEDKLDLQDRLLVKRFEIKNIEKWQQYTLRKSLLLVRALSRQVGDAMAAFGSTANKSEREQRVKGWKMVLQDLEAVVLSINRAGIKNKEGKGAAGRRKNFDFDLDGWLWDVLDWFGISFDGLIESFLTDAISDMAQDEIPALVADAVQDLEIAQSFEIENNIYDFNNDSDQQ